MSLLRKMPINENLRRRGREVKPVTHRKDNTIFVTNRKEKCIRPEDTMKLKIRRQWNHWQVAEVEYSKLRDLHWDNRSGGVQALANQYYIHAKVLCNEYDGVLPHSCKHGYFPHLIKVCIIQKDNDKDVFARLKSVLEEKPKYFKVRK